MNFVFLLKTWKDKHIKGYALGKAAALAQLSARSSQVMPGLPCWVKVLSCSRALQGEKRHVRQEEVEGALQSTGAIPLSPQIARESRRRRLTCLLTSLILYSHMKESRSNLRTGKVPAKGQGEPISPLTTHLPSAEC